MVGTLLAVVAILGPAQASPAKKKPQTTAGRWTVKKAVSTMDDSQTVVLALHANNAVTGWPRRVSTPTLLLRCHEGDVEAYLSLGMPPQVESGNLDGATIAVRFGQESAEEFGMNKSTDGDALFFRDAKGVIFRMLAHRTMRFRFVPFNSAPQEASFTLTGLGGVIGSLQKACDWYPEKEAAATNTSEIAAITERTGQLLDMSLPESRRLTAAYDLENMRPSPNRRLAVPALVKALQDPYLPVRIGAARALGNIGAAAADEAVPALEALTTDPAIDARLAAEARKALKSIRPQPAP